ncbi:hypothetical protein, partial [Methylobacterium crusticola]|uniref:hypothetical protein n=1 Tax=Methylobacterium crusticola TaxID=1697972 RepID=UPI001EE34D01
LFQPWITFFNVSLRRNSVRLDLYVCFSYLEETPKQYAEIPKQKHPAPLLQAADFQFSVKRFSFNNPLFN